MKKIYGIALIFLFSPSAFSADKIECSVRFDSKVFSKKSKKVTKKNLGLTGFAKTKHDGRDLTLSYKFFLDRTGGKDIMNMTIQDGSDTKYITKPMKPGQTVSWSIYDTYGWPAPDVSCQWKSKSKLGNRAFVKCRKAGGTNYFKTRWVNRHAKGIVEYDAGDSIYTMYLYTKKVSIMNGQSSDHVLDDFTFNLEKRESVTFGDIDSYLVTCDGY